VKEITTHGVTLTVDPDILDDYEILVLIKRLDNKELQYVPDIIRKLLGEEQERKVIDAMVADQGKCRISDMNLIISDVIEQLSAQDDSAKK
jgi:hypothetical protein